MKNKILILLLLIGFGAFSQNHKVEQISFKEKYTIAERDAFSLGVDDRKLIYIVDTGINEAQIWDGDSWESLGGTGGSSDGYINGVSFSGNLLTFTRIGAGAFSGSVDLSSLSGGSVSLPSNQIGVGTGSGITSFTDFTWNNITKTFNINGDGTANDSAFLSINSNTFFEIRDSDSSIRTNNDVYANSFIINSGTGLNQLLDNGMTVPRGVSTVTGTAVDNTDPLNPIINATAGGQVNTIVAGTNITVDNTDPINPIISSTGGGSGGDITSVLNVSALRAFSTAPADGALFYVKGHTVDDVGGGIFRWDNTSTATDRNGVFIKATSITTGRFIRQHNGILDITDFGGLNKDLDTGDDTQAFLDMYAYARDYPFYLTVMRSAKFTIEQGQYRVTPNHTANTFDGSNVHFSGNGSVSIESTLGAGSSGIGRGSLFIFSANTTNFTWEGIDIVTDPSITMTSFQQGIFTSVDGGLDKLTFKDFEINTGVEAGSSGGLTLFNFYHDETDTLDTDENGTITIDGVIATQYGQQMYGARFIRKTNDIIFNNNRFTSSSDAVESYNALAVYGNSSIKAKNNKAWNWKHTPFAFSMCYNIMFDQWEAYGTNSGLEAGAEIEYKNVHGFDDIQTQNIIITNGYVEDCVYGVWITERDDDATTIAPKNIIISNIQTRNIITHDLYIGDTNASTGSETSILANIKIDNFDAISPNATYGVHIASGENISVTNSSFVGQSQNAHIGRNSSIYPTGRISFENCYFKDATNQAFLVESIGASLSVKNSYFINMGVRGFQSTATVVSATRFDITGNEFIAGTSSSEGIRISNFASIVNGSDVSHNYLKGFTGKGINVSMDNSTVVYNKMDGCGTTSTFTGTGIVATAGTNVEF